MKKYAVSIIFTLIMAGILLLPAVTMLANAAAAGYIHTTYFLANAVTLDGKCTGTEWDDTPITVFGNNTAVFRSKWAMDPFIGQYLLVEVLNDNTNDAGDLLQLCFDGDMSGGATPQTGDVRIDITGHTTLTAYNGNGAGWSQTTAPGSFTWNSSIGTSPLMSSPHWIYEILIDKQTFGIGAEYWMRVAVSDANNAPAGVRSWPPTSRDVPNDWGDIPYLFETIPEGVGLGSMVLLLSVAVVIGVFGLRKKGKLAIKQTR